MLILHISGSQPWLHIEVTGSFKKKITNALA